MQAPIVGIEIGGTKLQLLRGDAAGTICARARFQVDRTAGATGIRAHIESTLRQWLDDGGVRAVGVGYGGPVDWRTGRICCSHHVEGWSEFPLGDWLRGIAGVPVSVDNDANVAALGEAVLGAGRGANPAGYVTLGSGVGGGLVVDGRIYHGASPGEVEIGHVCLDRSGATVESRCAGWSVDRRIRAAIGREPASVLAGLVGSATAGEARFLGPALAVGDPTAGRILAELAEDLAFGLSHFAHLFHPEILVLGGGLSLLGEPLRAAVAAVLPRFLMDAFQPGPRIVLAGLGEDSVPCGALLLGGAQGSRPTG